MTNYFKSDIISFALKFKLSFTNFIGQCFYYFYLFLNKPQTA